MIGPKRHDGYGAVEMRSIEIPRVESSILSKFKVPVFLLFAMSERRAVGAAHEETLIQSLLESVC